MKNQNLYYFIAVAEDLNISRTAERLYISQQALSEQIRKLEKHYDAVFFERKPRLRLTFQGEQMLSYAKKVVLAEQTLIGELKSCENSERVKLTIDVPSSRGISIIPYILEKYQVLHPNVILNVLSRDAESSDIKLLLGETDVYLGMLKQSTKSIISEKLYRDCLFFIVSSKLLKRILGDKMQTFLDDCQYGINIADASLFPIAMPPAETSLRQAMEITYLNNGVSPNVVMETTSNEMMFDVCKSGFCSSYVTRELLYRKIQEQQFSNELYYFPTLWMGELSNFGISYRKGRQPEYISDFISCSKEIITSLINEMDEYLLRNTVTT